jgi:hypothetical protein
LNFNFDFRFARGVPRQDKRAKFLLCRDLKWLDDGRMNRMGQADNMCKLIPKSVNLDGKKWKKVTYMKKA